MEKQNFNYIKDLSKYERQNTLSVNIGDTPVGGNNPIRVQSMTDTDTKDTEATVKQIARIIKSGADYVRVAVQGMRESKNLKNIRQALDKMGYSTPLIADVHFNPAVAESTLKYVKKVRINPGNFYDPRAKFNILNYTDEEYKQELQRIKAKFIPFLSLCKQHNTAIRIGANQGSLSDRIMSRYGDTPTGIVESVMEYLRICQSENFKNVVVSIKSSNIRLMVYTVRLMNHRMRLEEMTFPFHIGVTEAGEGEDGRIRSAIGSGALLADGIGDTIRVSLTEDPAKEIPFAIKLINSFKNKNNHAPISAPLAAQTNPFEYERRSSRPAIDIGGGKPVVVIASLNKYSINEARSINSHIKPDFYYDGGQIFDSSGKKYPVMTLKDYLFDDIYTSRQKFVMTNKQEYDILKKESPEVVKKLKLERKAVIIMGSNNINSYAEMRAFFMELDTHICKNPVILHRSYSEDSYEKLLIKASADLGGLLIDGYGDGILLVNNGKVEYSSLNELAFGILQASRMRITKTEFISCPGCGRTLFDLKKVASDIKKNFTKQKHLKIGVMGCVVNGPGEMGDVDYGYVGSRPGHVNLYKGQKLVKQHLPCENAIEELKRLIIKNGDWRTGDK